MKQIRLVAGLWVCAVSLFLLSACGSGGEETEKPVPAKTGVGGAGQSAGQETPPAAAAPVSLAGAGSKVKAEQVPAAETAGKKTADRPYIKRDTYFRLPSHEKGKTVDLADMQDEPVLIAFITTRCPYCRVAMKALNTMHDKYNGQGLHVVTVAFEPSPERMAGFVQSNGVKFSAALGDEDVGARYTIRGVPQLYLLDRDHKVVTMWMGYSPEYDKDIAGLVEEVLAEKPSAGAVESAGNR
ncbi:MAG: TlpA disulfide reductase family protein [Elusimicrobiaceae bacterium]|nr:TlpA disulfide reductase family protein [Elusimicrobiaceae bacterium]